VRSAVSRGPGRRPQGGCGLSIRMDGSAPCLGLRETAERHRPYSTAGRTEAQQSPSHASRNDARPHRSTSHALSLRSDRDPNPDRRHIMNPHRCSPLEQISRGALLSISTLKAMASTGIKLGPETVDKIARRVVELLEQKGLQERELVDATELARRFGIERSWVYTHAIELGAVRLGNGSKPRLRFDPEIAAQVLRKVDGKPTADPPARAGKRAGQPQGSEGRVELLPIRGRGEKSPPPAA
jgi:hypothetical protein